VDTAYSAQGKSVQRVFISVGDTSVPALNARSWYVAASRGKEAVKLYVDHKGDVQDAIARTATRLSAVELIAPERSAKQRLREMADRSRVMQFLRNRSQSVARQWEYWSRGGRRHGGLQHA
jgi:hypothetical protein